MRKLWWALMTNQTIELKICITMWPTAAWLQQQDSSTFVYTHLVTCLDSSSLIYICLWLVYIPLHSSSDPSTLVYIRLVTRLHLSTFVCDSSTFVYARLVIRLYYLIRSFNTKTLKKPRCFSIQNSWDRWYRKRNQQH